MSRTPNRTKRRLKKSPVRGNKLPKRIPVSDSGKAILAMISQIPEGRVATYGQIAKLAGFPRNARQVGAVLRSLPVGSKVPWFRVVNSKGEISRRASTEIRSGNRKLDRDCESDQRLLLEAEGVLFDEKSRVVLKEFRWKS